MRHKDTRNKEDFNIEIGQKRVILIHIITQYTTNCIHVFHALYIGTWAVTAKREPLSLSLSLIITPKRDRFDLE